MGHDNVQQGRTKHN